MATVPTHTTKPFVLQLLNITEDTVLEPAIYNTVIATGSSALTLTLPAVTESPIGSPYFITNNSSATLTVNAFESLADAVNWRGKLAMMRHKVKAADMAVFQARHDNEDAARATLYDVKDKFTRLVNKISLVGDPLTDLAAGDSITFIVSDTGSWQQLNFIAGPTASQGIAVNATMPAVASGSPSVAIGNNAQATANNTVAIGSSPLSSAAQTITISATSTTNSVSGTFKVATSAEVFRANPPATGNIAYPTTLTTTTTPTATQLLGGLIFVSATGTVTLPLGTALTSGIDSAYAGMSFTCWLVPASGTVTITVAGNTGTVLTGTATAAAGIPIILLVHCISANNWAVYAK